MEPVSRRSLLVTGSVGVAGVASGLGLGRVRSGDDASTDEPSAAQLEELGDQTMLLNVRDARTGEVEVYWGEQEAVFTDRSLVARMLKATRQEAR